jgi:DNA-binding transcriptional ArsR family regulator
MAEHRRLCEIFASRTLHRAWTCGWLGHGSKSNSDTGRAFRLQIYIRIFLYMQDALRQFKAEFFQALAHPTRIAIVEQLREGELSAGALIERLKIEQANASQHLAVLRGKNIVVSRKSGNQVFYSVRHPLIIEVLNVMRRYFHVHMSEAVASIKALDQAEKTRR